MKLLDKGALMTAAAVLLTAASPFAAMAEAPLVVGEQGNFRVGGREVEVPEGTIVAGAMYVEYQIPAELEHPYPLVFIHGGASDGSAFWSTPDGREGWATLFLRKGYAVYVVDRPTLGRSPHHEPADGPKVMPPMAVPETDGDAPTVPQVKQGTRYPGPRQAGGAAYEQDLRRRHSTVEVPFGAPRDPLEVSTYVDRIDRDAGAALLDRIGPAILVTHSRAGTSGWQIADARLGLVKAIIAAEPNGPPFYNDPPLGRPGDAQARPFGITCASLEFSPPVSGLEDFGPLHQEAAPSLSTFGCWLATGEPRRLVNLAHVPVLVLTGGSSYHAAYDYCTAGFLQRAGVPAEYMLLDDQGIEGNTHGFPTETNNGEIADLIAGWLERRGL
jgi:pimeloyl-ACP methyl ester carboxylesterase